MSEEIKNVQEELNEQMQIRRDKLAEYEVDGIYPFGQRFVVKDNAKEIKDGRSEVALSKEEQIVLEDCMNK